jgi:hypothetical protein
MVAQEVHKKVLFILAVFIFISYPFAQKGDNSNQVSYIDLINRLIDLKQLAILPQEGERCAQWSSYDRRSKYDSPREEYIEWDANEDGHGFIRREGGKKVLAEMEGPGCIWRIWSALPSENKLEIYLDNSTNPVYSDGFREIFSGRISPFTYDELVWGHFFNLYFPLSYQNSCKILSADDFGYYYHFTYYSYPLETNLPTFSESLTSEEEEALRRINEELKNRGRRDFSRLQPGEEKVEQEVSVGPFERVTLVEILEPRAINTLEIEINYSLYGELAPAILRELALQITWDEESVPAVWSPLGDFFGVGYGHAELVVDGRYRTLVTGYQDGVFYSHWYMPFEKAKIEIINDGGMSHTITCRIIHEPLTRSLPELGRFHAKWHRDVFLPSESGRAGFDWTILKTKGRGRYCGAMLHVFNRKGDWWGEGDEKFFVDGEKFPSTFGTGSEDYFGYSWCSRNLFSRSYHYQIISEGNSTANRHTVNGRFHIADNVPFQTSFEASIEKYYRGEQAFYACVAYWYLAPGGEDLYQPVSVNDRLAYCGIEPTLNLNLDEMNQLGKRLIPNYPNPFNPECYIPVNAKCKRQNVKCKIYNILGQLVREIECSGVQEFKGSKVYWDGRDSRGLKVPSGVYFYEVGEEAVRKMVVLR